MENEEKNEVMQEKAEVKKGFLNKDVNIENETGNSFYGGADMRISRIKVISDKALPIK